MRILQVNSMLTGGGTDDQCLKLAASLRALNLEVRLAGPGNRECSPLVAAAGVPHLVTPPEGPLKLRFILAVARAIRRHRIQIVHGHHGRDLWPTILAARASGRRPRIVLTRHLAKSPSSWFSRAFVLGQCDALIAVSQFVARVLEEGVSEPNATEPERRARPPLRGDHRKIQVIPCGVDTDRFRPADAAAQRAAWGLNPDDYAFAVVGGFPRPRGKGQREFLQAAARLHRQAPRARFLIVGRGELESPLREDIEKLGLKGKARLTGYATDMPQVMNAIDCLVHPQIGTEAFGLVVAEAQACGRPVIVSDLDGIPEAVVNDAWGRRIPPGDVETLAAEMAMMIRRRLPTAEQRGTLHRLVEARFGLRQLAATTRDLYGRLLPRDDAGSLPITDDKCL